VSLPQRGFFETGPRYVTQAGLELVIPLPQPLECWDYRCCTMPSFSERLKKKKLSKIKTNPPTPVIITIYLLWFGWFHIATVTDDIH
jgi:hypothetical protein